MMDPRWLFFIFTLGASTITTPASTTTTPASTTARTPGSLSPTLNKSLRDVATKPPTTAPSTTTQNTTTPSTTTPSTTTQNTTTTSSAVGCQNGGVCLNGVCLCPDGWAGKTCSQANFCAAEELDGFQFPQTPVGWFAYSLQNCSEGTKAEGKPQATIRCSTRTGSPGFERPVRVLQCNQTLSDLLQNLTSSEDLDSLISATQILTSRPENLTGEDVTAAVQISNTLLLSPNATESVSVSAVATVSQLLNAGPGVGRGDSGTLGLTVTLDQLALNLSLGVNASEAQVVQPNLVLQSLQIPVAGTQGVQFTSLSGQSDNFVTDRIQLNPNTSDLAVEEGFLADAVMLVHLPPAARNESLNASLGFVLYQNDRFFTSRRYRPRHAAIRVLSASVQGQGRSVTPQRLEMMFRPKLMNGTSLYDFSCVFWDYVEGDWSTAGCSKDSASNGVLRCFCNHTTNFAALWSFRQDYDYVETLNWISTVGLSLSLVGLIVTILHHFNDTFAARCVQGKEVQVKSSQVALLSICVSLLAFIITFIIGVGHSRLEAPAEPVLQDNAVLDSDEHVDPDSGSCTAVTALLHYFLLATFMWNSLYGTVLLLVDSLRRTLPRFWTPLSLALGWGLPAVVMATTIGLTYSVDNPLGYRQEEFCWLAGLDHNKEFHIHKPFFWAFLVPVLLVLVYNMLLLVWILIRGREKSRKKILISISLAIVLGLSWAMGYLVLVTTETVNLVLSILFCVFTATQGLQIFVLLTARTPSFRASVSKSIKSAKSITSIKKPNRKYNMSTSWTSEFSGDSGFSDLYRSTRV